MKKLIVAAVVLTTTASAFAQTHMVRLYGLDKDLTGAPEARSVDFSMNSSNPDSDDVKNQNLALNYAYAFGQFQLGLEYRNRTMSAATDSDITSLGLSFYYNFDEDLANTWLVGLHYKMHTTSDGGFAPADGDDALGEDDTANTIVLEAGRRIKLTEWNGVTLAYSPNVYYAITSYDWDATADDDANGSNFTELAWNFVKIDVLF